MKTRWRILVVDAEEVVRDSLAAWLREDGYTVDTARSGSEAAGMATKRDYAIYFVALEMPGGSNGLETSIEIGRMQPEAAIVIITPYAAVETAVSAMKQGAQEYVIKPCNLEEISLLVSRIVKVKNLQRENSILREKLTRQKGAPSKSWALPAGMTLQEMERLLIAATIQQTEGNIKEAASVLGIDRSTLYEKIKRYEIPR